MRMTISPQDNRSLPFDYADDDTTSVCSFYSNLQNPYNIPYTEQDQRQYQHHLQATPDPPQPILSSLDHLPSILMPPSQCLDSNNENSNSNNNSCNRNNTKLEGDYGTNHNDTGFYSHDSSFWPTVSQISMVPKSMSKPNEINNSERGVAGFVSKLYQSLQMTQNNHSFVRWCRHDGKDMFLIDCIPRFTEEVLPRLFKHCKFQSFVRQLNIYGFQRDTDARKSKDTKDKEICRWHHPFFRPGRRDLIHLIRRKATLHTRRKRMIQTADQNPETIVNMDSDDDDSDGDGEKQQRHHPSASNSISNLPFQQSSSELPSSLVQQQQQQHPPTPSQDVYGKTVPAPYFTLVDSIMHQTASPSSSPPPTSSSSSSLSSSTLYMQEVMQPSMEHFMEQSMETVDSSTTSMTRSHSVSQPSVYQLTDNTTQLSPTSSSSSSAPPLELNNMENELQQHLLQLQINYNNDREFYTKQIQLAHAHIKEQQAHIDQLEAISTQRQRIAQNHYHHYQQQPLDPSSTADKSTGLINNTTIHPSDPVSSHYITTKNELGYESVDGGKEMVGKMTPPKWSVLSSSPNDLPNPHYQGALDTYYSAITGPAPSPLTPSHPTFGNLTTSLLTSSLSSSTAAAASHTKKVALQP